MTFVVLMLFAGIIVNEVVIRPWIRAGQRVDELINEIDEMRNNG